MNDREILYDKLSKLKATSHDFDFIKRTYKAFAIKNNYRGDIVDEVFTEFVNDPKGAGKPKYPQSGVQEPLLISKSNGASIIEFE